MREERRLEPKRMDIHKPIELIGSDGDRICLGTTDNLSDEGIGACFNTVPALDSDVLLHIFWDPDNQPIEQPAKVMWTDGQKGAARVGLRVGELPAAGGRPAPPETSVDQVSVETADRSPLFLELGRPVVMSTGGVAIETVVSDIGPIQADNTVQVVLRITDDAFTEPSAYAPGGELPAETEDWTPHPLRDAWRSAARYAGPVFAVLFRWSRALLLLAAGLSRPAWRRMPKSVRTRGQAAGRFLTDRLGPLLHSAKAGVRRLSKK